MNLQKINKKIEKQKNKLSDLFRMRDGMLKMQELKAQDPEVTATRKKKKRKKGEEEEKTPEQLAVEKQAEILRGGQNEGYMRHYRHPAFDALWA